MFFNDLSLYADFWQAHRNASLIILKLKRGASRHFVQPVGWS
jgi:hypothetical protein